MKANLDRKTGVYKYGYAKHMRDALPNASFLGFTGTPVSAEGSRYSRCIWRLRLNL